MNNQTDDLTQDQPTNEGNKVEEGKIEELYLSMRAKKSLHKAGITLISQFLKLTLPELEAIDGMGKKSRQEILVKQQEISGALQRAREESSEEIFRLDKSLISIVDYVKNYPDKRIANMMTQRMAGKTLEEIGNEQGLSRERIRAIGKKFFQEAPPLREDAFRYLFEKYHLSIDEFLVITQQNSTTYYYLVGRFRLGKSVLEEMEADKNIPLEFRRNARKIIFQNYVFINGQPVQKKKDYLAKFAFRAIGSSECTIEELETYYGSILKELKLDKNPEFHYQERVLNNKISGSDYSLWKLGKKFRYYNIAIHDYTHFFEELALEQYDDIEFSTRKLFTEYPHLMAEYDIQDEYELHNLLKKICAKNQYPKLRFQRMPMLAFGDPKREKQVVELMLSLSPVTQVAFAQAYEDAYGVLGRTVVANFLPFIEQYYNQGIYTTEMLSKAQTMPEEAVVLMKSLLKKEFYMLKDISALYEKKCPQGEPGHINPWSMKQLGFHTYLSYVVSDRYPSASSYFRKLLTQKDRIEIKQFPDEQSRLMTFMSELYKEKEQFELLEYEPKKYIHIRELKRQGVTKKDLIDFCEKATIFGGQFEYFTVHFIESHGFTHPLQDLPFDQWFYAGLLATYKKGLVSQRMGGNKLFAAVNHPVLMTDFIPWLVEQEGRMSLQNLSTMLKEIYDLKVDNYTLAEVARETNLYHDLSTGTVYPSYQEYEKETGEG